MNVAETALSIYTALRDNPAALTEIRKERAALALRIATSSNGGMTIVSSTVNGQSFTASNSVTASERLKILSRVCAMADAGIRISNKPVALF